MPSTLITGANRGLGLEFAKQYLADNWQVCAACRDPSSASDLRRIADGSGGKLQVLSMDVSDLANVRAAAVELKGKPIDLLLNNAGIGGPRGQTIGNIDYETWARVLDVNTLGPMRVSEAFVDNVARSDRKLIVTITSGMGSIKLIRRCIRLSHLKGCRKHGHAESGGRPRTSWHHVCGD